jgi:regulatory protein
VPGKARPPKPGSGQAKKAVVRKRTGGLYAVPDAAVSADAAPSAKATVAGAPDEVTSRKRPGSEGATPGWAVPGVTDMATPGERPGGDEAVPDWAAPDEAPVPDDMEMASAGLWPDADEPSRDGAAVREWFGGEEAARAACLKMLVRAPRTRAQLAAALRRRRVPDEIAESVLARFTEVGLINDAAFARAWVESRHHSKGLARRALAAELRQRGVADGEVRAAVSSLGTQDEVAAARRLVAKRIAATRGRPLPARARQLLGVLARKGYSAGLAAKVVREALEQEEPDNPDDRLDLAQFCEDSASGDWL